MKGNTYSRRGGGKQASAPAPADSFDDFVAEKKKPSAGKKKNTGSGKGKSKKDKPQVKSYFVFEIFCFLHFASKENQ